jgi:hypothetical protein
LARRIRTAKKLAKRIDLSYFKHPSALKRVRFFLSLAAVLIAAVWLVSMGARGSNHAYSPGPLSEPHATFGNRCELCHVTQGKGAAKKMQVSDKACLSCHDGPRHTKESPVESCAGCHTEHHGAHLQLASVKDATCARCHATEKPPVTGFLTDHPDFPELSKPDPGTVKLNHKAHLAQNLTCDTCHNRVDVPCKPKGANCARATTSFAFMAPATYADTCASCHDDRDLKTTFGDTAPHGKPEDIEAWFQKTHPGDALKIVYAEQQLWTKSCPVCHDGIENTPGQLPKIQPAATPTRWLTKAVFSHDAHRSMDCLDCHANIPSSTKTADVNLPDVKTCQTCHRPEHAESQCFECHVYHEWPREKAIQGKFKLNQVAGSTANVPALASEITPPAANR